MATRVWNSSSSTDMNLATNYTGDGSLLTTDDLIFNNTSQITASSTAALSVNSITCSSTYMGEFYNIDYPITTNTSIKFLQSGILTLGNRITIRNSGDFSISAAPTAITASSCSLYMMNDGDIAITKTNTYLDEIHCSYPGKYTTWTTSSTITGCEVLGIHGGVLDFRSTVFNDILIIPRKSQQNPFIVDEGSLIVVPSTTAGIIIRPWNSTDLTIYVPGFTFIGRGEFKLTMTTSASGNVNYQQTGDITSPLFEIGKYSGSSSYSFNYNSNGNKLNVHTSGKLGYITLINSVAGTQIETSFANSYINCDLFRTSGGQAIKKVDLTNTILDISGGMSYTPIPTSGIFTGSFISFLASGTFNPKGLSYNNIKVDIPGNQCTFAQGLSCNRLIVTPDTRCKLQSASGFIVSGYQLGDFDSCNIQATTSGNLSNLTLPADVKISNVTFQDIKLINPIFSYGCTSVRSSGLVFPNKVFVPKLTTSLLRR